MRKMAFALFISAVMALAPVAAWAQDAEPSAWAEPIASAEPTAWVAQAAAPEETQVVTQSPEETPSEPEETTDPGDPEEPTPTPGVSTYTAYTKKSAYLYKAKKAVTKGALKVRANEPVEVIEKGKTWTKAMYGDRIGYFKTNVLTTEPPATTPAPTPTPGRIALPTSAAETVYVGQAAEITLPVSQVITAFILDYCGLGSGSFSEVDRTVSAGFEDIVKGIVPNSLSKYEGVSAVVAAVASDIPSGLTLELLGKAFNAKQTKENQLFTKSGSTIGTYTEEGSPLYAFDSLTVRSGITRGTYYLQINVKAPSIRALYPEAESLTLLVPITVAKMSGSGGGGGGSSGSKALPVPRLILEGVRTDPPNPKAGETFDIILTLRNTSDALSLRNLQMTYTSDNDVLRPVSGSNIEYIDRIDVGSQYEHRLHVTARPDLEESTVVLDINIDFEDNKLNALSQPLRALITVQQELRMRLDEPILPTITELTAGDSYDVSLGVFNMGKSKLYNVVVRAVPEDPETLSPGQSVYIGEMEPSTSKVAELSLVPQVAGDYKANLEVTYESVDGTVQKPEIKSISFTATEPLTEDYGLYGADEYGEEEEVPEKPGAMDILAVLPWWLYAAAGVVLVMLTMMIGVSARKRRIRALEDDEMD